MEEISVQFLGSGDAFGSGGRFQTCIHVRFNTTHFLLDCGASSLIAMKRYGLGPSLVDTILITHLHGDHFGGLPFFIMEAQYVSHRRKPLVVAGPPGLEDRINEAMEVLYPGSSQTQREFALKFVELTEETGTPIGSLVVTAYEVVHPSGAPSYALRVVCGSKIVAYSGDTEWTDALIRAARGADLFICNCYFFDKGGLVPPRLSNAYGTPDGAGVPQTRPDSHKRRDAAPDPKPRRRRGGGRQELHVVARDHPRRRGQGLGARILPP